MGGGTAAMLTMMLREHKALDARCVALACPACMTLELAQGCKDFVTTVVNGTDIVPTFCSGVRASVCMRVRVCACVPVFKVCQGCLSGHGEGLRVPVRITRFGYYAGVIVDLAQCVCVCLLWAATCRTTSCVYAFHHPPVAATVDALREDVRASSWFLEFQRDLRASVSRAWQVREPSVAD